MIGKWVGTAVVTGVALVGSVDARADVRLTIADGHVTLEAKDATVRQILDEWARVGQTKFVNVERLTGGPLTLQLTNTPEAQALEILLRSASGYLLAPRPVALANASQFDRILVMPTSTPPRASAGPVPSPQSTFPSPQLPPGFPQPDSDDDDPIPGGPPGANPNPRGGPGFPSFPGAGPQGPGAASQRGPVFPGQASPFPAPATSGPGATPAGAFPPPGSAFPPAGGAFPSGGAFPPFGTFPTATPQGTMPVGVAVPGMIVQPPVQSNPPSQLDRQ